MGKTYCIFSANYLPHLGGVERYTHNLAKKLFEKGNRVIIVTSNTYHLSSVEKIDNIEIYRMPCFNLLNGRFPVIKVNREYKNIYKQLFEIPIDIVIINTRFYPHSYSGVKFAYRKKVKNIVIEHGTNHFTVNNKFLDCMGHIYEHGITHLIKKYCKNFYGVSEACSLWLKHFGIRTDGILYNAIDIEQINNCLMNPVINYKEQWGLNETSIVVTYTGRLVKEKGILKLIEAFRKLLKDYNNVYLFIAGDGDLYKEISLLKNEHLIVLGKINFENVIALLSQTDVFCLPTDYPEGFPTSVLEAVSCKCFTVTTKSGGSKELIINPQYGIILKENTVDEIYKSIKYGIENEDYRQNATILSYKRLVNNFTWDIVAEKVMQL